MTKHIISLSVDEDDEARIELTKQLYNISTRSECVRQAIKMMLDAKLQERKSDEN